MESMSSSLRLTEPGRPLSVRTLVCCHVERWEGHFSMTVAIEGLG